MFGFLKDFGVPARKAYKAMGKLPAEEYVNYFEHGLSLLFRGDKLDSVFLYNDGIDGYKAFKGPLPHKLEMKMFNTEVVNTLGEPSKKAPYSNVAPIWIEYSEIGVTINFKYRSYEDTDNPITSLALFR